MKKKLIKISLILISTIFISNLAYSQKDPKGPKGPKGPKPSLNSNTETQTQPAVSGNESTELSKSESSSLAKKSFNKKHAQEAIKKAETLRSVDHSESSVDLESFSKNAKENIKYQLKILRSTNLRAYLEFLAPDYERGRHMLAIGKKYWSKFPDSKRVVEISRKEAIGNTAFEMGDLFQIDADNDYDPVDLQNEDSLTKITLISKHPDTTYNKIEYYLTSDNYPVKAKFYGVSNKHIKTMYIEKSAKLAGMKRPSVLKMIDEINQGKYSVWTTKKLKLKNIPDSIFSTSYLKGR